MQPKLCNDGGHSRQARKMQGIILAIIASLGNTIAFAQTASAGSFSITGITVYGAGNMTVRVWGLASQSICPGSSGWAYVDETDSGSKEKIAFLYSAYYSGKPISLTLQANNFFGNGALYCQITAVGG